MRPNNTKLHIVTLFLLSIACSAHDPVEVTLNPRWPETALTVEQRKQAHEGKLSALDVAAIIHTNAHRLCSLKGHFGVHSFELIAPEDEEKIERKAGFKTLWCENDDPLEAKGGPINETDLIRAYDAYAQFPEVKSNRVFVVDQELMHKVLARSMPATTDYLKSLLAKNRYRIWLDLESAQWYALPEQMAELATRIERYHSIHKSDPQLFDDRIRALDDIATFAGANRFGDDESTRLKAALISQTAHNKKTYLEALKKVPARYQEHVAIVQKSMPNVYKHQGVLTYFSGSYRDELLGFLDPARRANSRLFDSWFFLHKAYDTTDRHDSHVYWMDFLYSLEEHDLKGYEVPFSDRPLVSSEGRKVVFFHGQAYTQRKLSPESAELPTLIDGENYYLVPKPERQGYLYNIDRHGDLYLALSGKHSGVNEGRPALSAGWVRFEDGKITYIDTNSGHYVPTHGHLLNALATMRAKHGDEIFHESFSTSRESGESYIPKFWEELSLKRVLTIASRLTGENLKEKILTNGYQREPLSFADVKELYNSMAEKDYVSLLDKEQELFKEVHYRIPRSALRLTPETEAILVKGLITQIKKAGTNASKHYEVVFDEARVRLANLLIGGQDITSADSEIGYELLETLNKIGELFARITALYHEENPTLVELYLIMKDLGNYVRVGDGYPDFKFKVGRIDGASALKEVLSNLVEMYERSLVGIFGPPKLIAMPGFIDPEIGSTGLTRVPLYLRQIAESTKVADELIHIIYKNEAYSKEQILELVEKREKELKEIKEEIAPIVRIKNWVIRKEIPELTGD